MDSKEKQNSFIKISKKLLISFLLVAIVVVSIPFNHEFAAGFSISQQSLTYKGITIKVESSKSIKELYMYTKSRSNDTYLLFYQYSGGSFRSKNFFISNKRLSTSATTGLRVMAVYEDGQRETNVVTVPSLPSAPTPTPSQTTSPRPSPTPSQTTSPRPSSTPSTLPTPTPTPTTPDPTKSAGAQKVEEKINKVIEEKSLKSDDKVYFLDTADVDKQTINGREVDKAKASDCIILESGGRFGMIDTSINKSGYKRMATRVLAYLEALNVTELDFVLITHAHGDHTGCYPAISEKIKINHLYIKKRETKGEYNKVIRAADAQGTTKHFVTSDENTRIVFGDFNIKLYNRKQRIPQKSNGEDKKTASGETINENVNSIVALATIRDKKIVFTGDVGNYEVNGGDVTNAENTAARNIGKVHVYKASHHAYYAKNNSVTALSYYKPKYAVITNTSTRDGTSPTKTRLRDRGVTNNHIYCSGDGTVILNITRTGTLKFGQIAKDDNINFDT